MKLKSCTICLQEFKRNEHLHRHLMTHSGERKHKCQTCSKSFSRLDSLQRHAKLHSVMETKTGTLEPRMDILVEGVFGLITMRNKQAIPIKNLINIPATAVGREMLSIRNLIC